MRFHKKWRSKRFPRSFSFQTLDDRRLLTAAAAEVGGEPTVLACYADTYLSTETLLADSGTSVGAEQNTGGRSGGGHKPSNAGISVSAVNPTTAGLQTTEQGGTDQFLVVLASKPTANVTIDLFSSNEMEGVVSTSSLPFTPDDWDVPQIVTVMGVQDDGLEDGDQIYWVITMPAVSADPSYDGLDPDDLPVTNVDDDSTIDVIYVRSVESIPRLRGPHIDVQFVVDVRIDSDHNGMADESDSPAPGAQVVLSVYDSTDTNLNNDSNVWNFLGTTSSDGTYHTAWLKDLTLPQYYIEVHELDLDGYHWDPFGTLESGLGDADSDGRPDFELML